MSQQDDDYIIFEEIGKDGTQSTSIEKQPILGDYEDLHDELLKKCNPANFMRPYNKEKVDIANDIYGQASRNKDNTAELMRLRKRAMQELDTRFSTIKLYSKLKDACSPEKFTGENYDANKLRQANELYAQILENADDIEALEEIEQRAYQFIEYAEEQERRRQEKLKRIDDKDDQFFVISIIAIMISIITIIFILLINNSASNTYNY